MPVTNRSFLAAASLLIVTRLSGVSAMDIVVKDGMRCESRPIKASITFMCNKKQVCTLNDQKALMEGTFTYYGLYDIEGATSNDNLLIDAYASFNTHLGFKHRMSLMSLMEAFPVCGMVQKQNSNSNWYSNMYNKNGGSSCPNDGTYNFQTMFALDAPKSRFLSWFMTGYHGEAVVDIYMERTMDLVGRCHIPIKTKPTLPILSGMVSMTLLIVGTIILVSFGLAGKLPKCPPLPRSCLGRRRKGGEDDNNDVLLLPYEHQFGKTIETAKKYRKEPVTDLVAW